MKRATILFAVLFVALLASLRPNIARADGPTTEDAGKVATTQVHTTGGTMAVPSTLSAATTYCRWAQVSVTEYNIIHIKLFTYYQKIEWCYNGSVVLSHSRYVWGTVSYPWWEYKGTILSEQHGGNYYSYYSSYVKGHFVYCPIKLSCIQNKYPWISMTVRGNGSWSYSWGG